MTLIAAALAAVLATLTPLEQADVAHYFGDRAVETGEAVWVNDELVPATLDLWTYLALADCESGGRWHLDSYPFRGGLQFLPSTWRAVGGAGDPATASVAEQIERARILVTLKGWEPWPACSRRLGLRTS